MSQNYKQKIGAWGEKVAEKFYQQRGWQTVAKNYRTPCGELDLIFQKMDLVLAVEVKTRRGRSFGWSEECINEAKLERLQKTCLWAQEKLNLNSAWQLEICLIDIIKDRVQIRRRLL